MKKITYLISILCFLNLLNGCSGYKPIFGSTNLQFKISEYLIKGDEEIGNKLYSKLNNLSKSQKRTPDSPQIFLSINVTKDKEKMSTDTAGKTIGYKITINITVDIKNYTTNKNILNQKFSSSALYNVQELYSDTVKAENKTIEQLIQNLYQKILINFSEKISKE